MTRMTANGYTIIQVRGYSDRNKGTWTYAWAGSPIFVGDSFTLVVDGREWEVEVVALGSEYNGIVKTIGGKFGLSYNL